MLSTYLNQAVDSVNNSFNTVGQNIHTHLNTLPRLNIAINILSVAQPLCYLVGTYFAARKVVSYGSLTLASKIAGRIGNKTLASSWESKTKGALKGIATDLKKAGVLFAVGYGCQAIEPALVNMQTTLHADQAAAAAEKAFRSLAFARPDYLEGIAAPTTKMLMIAPPAIVKKYMYEAVWEKMPASVNQIFEGLNHQLEIGKFVNTNVKPISRQLTEAGLKFIKAGLKFIEPGLKFTEAGLSRAGRGFETHVVPKFSPATEYAKVNVLPTLVTTIEKVSSFVAPIVESVYKKYNSTVVAEILQETNPEEKPFIEATGGGFSALALGHSSIKVGVSRILCK